MFITASIQNSLGQHNASVATGGIETAISIAPKPEGYGSSVNGGELLFLSLATCCCNDIYREAAKRKMKIASVNVKVSGEFGREGEPGKNINYQVSIDAPGHSADEINDLIRYVDTVAEIHNTLRQGTAVILKTSIET